MRLPPSIIALIESHLPPHQSITQIQQIKPQKLPNYIFSPSQRPLPPRGVLSSPPSELNKSRPHTARFKIISGACHNISKYLRRHRRTPFPALQLAHGYLHADSATSRSITSFIERQTLYSEIIKTFHASDCHVAVQSIFNRQLEEGITPTVACMTMVLGSCLRSSESSTPLLQKLFPLIPEQLDVQFLSVFLEAVIRDHDPNPSDVEKAITESLALTNAGSGHEWPIQMYSILIRAHANQGNFRGAVDILAKLVSSVQRSHPVKESLSSDEIHQITHTYISVLQLWSTCPQMSRRRKGSLVPRTLARDLQRLVGTDNIDVAWFNAWFVAERLAENVQTALMVWDALKLKAASSTAERGCTDGVRVSGPDEISYINHFKLSKLLPCSQLPPLVAELLLDGPTLTRPLLNAAISATIKHRDLPLTLLLLRSFDLSGKRQTSIKIENWAMPDSRTVDIVSGGLIRLWRKEACLDSLFGPRSRNRASCTPELFGASPAEWDAVTRALRDIPSSEMSVAKNVTQLNLPLSSPFARANSNTEALNTNATNIKVETHHSIYTPKNSLRKDSDRRTAGTVNSPLNIIGPLTRLLEKAMVRLHLGDMAHEVERHERFVKSIMRPVYQAVWPKER